MDLEWLYGLDELKSYTVNTKQGRERLDVFIKHLPNLLDTADIHLPQEPRILCLMAGSCMEGIAYATVLKAKVTCLDIQTKMLTVGKKEAKRRRLSIQTVHSDAVNLDKETQGPFDLVTIHGAPLPHIDIFTFDKIADKVRKTISKNGTFLVDQSDVIFRILPYYREALVANTTPVVMNVHRSFNPKEGYFERLYYSRSKQERFKVYLWSPWIIQYVLRKNGFSKVRIDPYADPTTMAQTYLVSARK